MDYIPVLILLGVGILLAGTILVASHFLGPWLPNRYKDTAYECGQAPVVDAKHRMSVRFYLVAILFLLFDVEAIFFFPWAVVFRKYLTINSFILWEMGLFVGILLIGYFYLLARGAFEWE